jgi:hypothetical protein
MITTLINSQYMKLKFTSVIKSVLAKVMPCFEIQNWNYLTYNYKNMRVETADTVSLLL